MNELIKIPVKSLTCDGCIFNKGPDDITCYRPKELDDDSGIKGAECAFTFVYANQQPTTDKEVK